MFTIYLTLASLLITSVMVASILHFMPNMKTIRIRKFWFYLGVFIFLKVLFRVLELSHLINTRQCLYISTFIALVFSLYLIWFLNHHYGEINDDCK